MKKNYNLNMILSIIFISLIYSLAIGVKPAKADCVDVTQDPCFSGMFDVPTGMDTVEFYTWAAGYINQSVEKFEYLRTLDLMIDTCNIIGEKIYMLGCTSPYRGSDGGNACVYIKHVEKKATIPFGFTSQVLAGDTIEISDFDQRNTDLIDELNSLNTTFCKAKLVFLYQYTPNEIVFQLIFENHIQTLELTHYLEVMGYRDYEPPTIFSTLTNKVSEKNNKVSHKIIQVNDELHISTDFAFDNTGIEIYDLLGICQMRAVMNSSAKVLDISGLQRGLYFVKIGDQISKFMRE